MVTTAWVRFFYFTGIFSSIAWSFLSPYEQRKRLSPLAAEATFGMGCFWAPSERLEKLPGVRETIVGYTGVPGATQAPSYEKVCFSSDWVEGVRVVYDEKEISYLELLEAFVRAQEPKLGSRQYASIIFPHDSDQERIAKEWINKNRDRAREDGVSVPWTTVEPITPFFRAENYHQRYWQKTRPRVAGMIACLAISTGILDGVTPLHLQSTVHIVANIAVLAGFTYVVAERKLDNSVVRL